jgi:5-methylthioadenosine/S-adenosylhomocysteine deaminase
MDEILVRGRTVLRGVSAGGAAELVENGAVLVRAGLVEAVGPFAALRAAHPDAQVMGSDRDVVAPGFVNAHHHVGLTPLQLGAPDMPLELWFAAKLGLRSVDPYLDTLHSAFELIASGVTTVQHLHISRGSPEEVDVETQAILRAYADIGLRASYSFAYRDQNRLVYEADETFLSRLPEALAAELRPWFDRQRMPIEAYLARFDELSARYGDKDGGRIAIQLAPANLHWCSDAALQAIGEASARRGAPMHIHLLETERQRAYAQQRFGRSAVAHLDRLGLLGPLATLGHMVWASDDDLDLVAERGVCICHNLSSNLRLGSGLARCGHFLARGIPTAIGIDEAGLNDDRDMLQELRLVLTTHGAAGLDDRGGLSAAEVFRMATEHGARTTPFRGRIGRLDPGQAADLVLYDWPTVTGPYLDAAIPLIDGLLRRAGGEAVRAVMIAGRLVYEDGRFAFADRAGVARELAAALSRPLSVAEARRRALSESLFPYVRLVYDDARRRVKTRQARVTDGAG